MDRNGRTSDLIKQGFRVLIGNGFNVDFWLDNWTGRGSLKQIYPRIFALALVKQGPIAKFGH